MNEAKSPRRASERPVTALPACFAFYIIASSRESRILLLLLTNPTSHIICALSSSNTRSKAANVLSIHKGHMSCQVTILVGQKKKLMWADWVKDALRLFNENCAWDNSKVLGLFISKVIFSGIDYVQDFVRHGLMANWHLLLWKRVHFFSVVKGKYWKWYFTELIGVWCTEFSTSFLGLLTSKKIIIIILIKMIIIIITIIIIIIINFSQTFCPFVLSPHIFNSSKSAT